MKLIRGMLGLFRVARDDAQTKPYMVGRGADGVVMTANPYTVKWSSPRDFSDWKPDPTTGSVKIEPERVGIKPPDRWAWEEWAKEVSTSLTLPGWSPCRFAQRSSGDDGKEMATFVLGVTRGAFGLWQRPHELYVSGENDEIKSEILTAVVHLRSGIGMGLFQKRETAAQACDIAGKIAPFEYIDHCLEDGSAWHVAALRTIHAWELMGIVAAVNVRVYNPGEIGIGPAYAMFGISTESANLNRPEKVS